jgi:5'-phosphate synthase pdxT subunit
LQGDFAEHMDALRRLGVETVEVRQQSDIDAIDGLIIPGGESTTISKLMDAYGLRTQIQERARAGMPVFGTCAGMIVMAREATDLPYETLGLMDISVQRNAFGRQLDSFEAELDFGELGSVDAVFIRAPLIKSVGPDVHVLSRLPDGTIVGAQQGSSLVISFHPELTKDLRVHRYFLDLVEAAAAK